MRVYFFLCDHSTESECLTRQLFGTTTSNFEWAAKIVPGDVLCLYNFERGDIWGPFEATSVAGCYAQEAWRGKFLVQIKVAQNQKSRKNNLLNANGKKFLTGRKSRPLHCLDDPLATSLLLWMEQQGKEF